MSSTTARYQVGATGRWYGYLTREDGSNLPLADISTAKVWLRDPATGQNIRGTEATPQTIWPSGTANFQFEEATVDGETKTRIGWDVQVADVALRNADAAREEHVADVYVTYSVGGVTKITRHQHRLICVDAPGLCTYDDVDIAMEGMNEDRARLLIENAIDAFGAMFEFKTQRRIRRTADTQVFTVRDGQRVINLRRYPVIGAVTIKEDIDGDFGAGITALDASDLFVDSERGTVEHKFRDFLKGAGALQATWTGGIMEDTSEVPSDLRWACARQVGYWWKRRDQMGLQSMSVAGSSISVYTQEPLLKEVVEVLRAYKRPPHW